MLHGDDKKRMLARLKRIEGQVAGIRRMIEDDTYCVDVLVQIAAARGALGKAGTVLLGNHVEHCVSAAFEHGDADERKVKVDELMHVFARYAGVGR